MYGGFYLQMMWFLSVKLWMRQSNSSVWPDPPAVTARMILIDDWFIDILAIVWFIDSRRKYWNCWCGFSTFFTGNLITSKLHHFAFNWVCLLEMAVYGLWEPLELFFPIFSQLFQGHCEKTMLLIMIINLRLCSILFFMHLHSYMTHLAAMRSQ